MESTIDVSCIICGFGGGLTMLAHTEEIAYFGEHTQVTLSCPGCGWRQTDFIPAEARDGSCQTYRIDSVEDLQVRVIRGSACTVRLVELDLEVRPGSHSRPVLLGRAYGISTPIIWRIGSHLRDRKVSFKRLSSPTGILS